MDWVKIRGHTEELFKKYRYGILILLIGVVLMCLPEMKTDEADFNQLSTTVVAEQLSLEQSLAAILSQIQGAGKVEVLLTESKGSETMYQSNTTNGNGSQKQDTVIITDGDRVQSGLVQHIVAPEYRGAIIVCEGADKPEVRLHIIEAVASVTGLGTDKISVLKMK